VPQQVDGDKRRLGHASFRRGAGRLLPDDLAVDDE
jgi:hypothetical protein